MFGKAYRCPDPGGREGVTYALTATPCSEGVQFWRCHPRDSFIQYHHWSSTYTPFIKATVNKEMKVDLKLVGSIFNAKVVELKADPILDTITIYYQYSVEGMPTMSEGMMLTCQETLDCCHGQVKYAMLNIPCVTTFIRLGRGGRNCQYIAPGTFIGATGTRRGAQTNHDGWSMLVSDLIHLEQDEVGRIQAVKVTGLDNLDSGEVYLSCDLNRPVRTDHDQQTNGRLFKIKHGAASKKGYKGTPHALRSHQCHLHKRHSGEVGDKVCLVRYIGTVAVFDRNSRAPDYLLAMMAIYDNDSFLVSWLTKMPTNGVQSMLYKRIELPTPASIDMGTWWQ